MKTILKLLSANQAKYDRKSSSNSEGFTLIELLVATIVAVLIITPMLTFVIDVLNSDTREEAKARGDEEIQAALKYMEQDMNQAIYFYNSSQIATLADDGVVPEVGSNPPVIVFWKRQLKQNAIPVSAANCTDPADCDDTHVLSLVAYYLDQRNTNPWCPSGSNCPAQITRYSVDDGVRDPTTGTYLCTDDGGSVNCDDTNERDSGFPADPTDANIVDATLTVDTALPNPEVLVSYIDSSTTDVPDAVDCAEALGITSDAIAEEQGFASKADAETETLSNPGLPGGGASNSFYACINPNANTAQVRVRGNSLQRVRDGAPYSDDASAYFPTGSIQVRGIGRFGG